MKKILLPVAVVLLAAIMAGCASLEIEHNPIEPMPQKKGSVALEVNNVREVEKGADDEYVVGRMRNLYGMPFPLEADNSMVEAMEALFTDALAAAGYEVVDDAPTTVVVDINLFWMDGYMGYQIDAKLTVSTNTGFKKEIIQKKGFAYMVRKDMPRAYVALMDLLGEHAIEAFNSPQFTSAVK